MIFTMILDDLGAGSGAADGKGGPGISMVPLRRYLCVGTLNVVDSIPPPIADSHATSGLAFAASNSVKTW